MLSRIKIFSLAIQSVLSQVVIFFVALVILSIIDTLLAFLLHYDNGKAEETVNIANFCLVFFLIVAIPTTVVATVNKAQLFRKTAIIAVIVMEVYILYTCHNLTNTIVLRHFIVLSFSLITSCAISLPLFKNSAT